MNARTLATRGAAPATADPREAAERRLRRVGAWLLLALLLLGALGLAWDIRWHISLGRDTFWSPPHVLLYSSIGGGGLVALAVILLETLRARQAGAALDATSRVRLWGFTGPLGFVVAGFGALTTIAAAPLDNYWHDLYGIDVALWTPFHMMGLIGAGILIIGSIYAFASEAVFDRLHGRQPRRLLGFSAMEWGLLLALANLLGLVLVLGQPALGRFPTFDVGALRILVYPVLVGFGAVAVLVCAARGVPVGVPVGGAAAVALLVVARAVLFEAFVPWAIRVSASAQGLEYRTGQPPTFSLVPVLLALIVLVPALVADAALPRVRSIWRLRSVDALGLLVAYPLLLGAFPLALWLAGGAARATLPPGTSMPLTPDGGTALWALPLALVAGALGARLGLAWGEILRLSHR